MKYALAVLILAAPAVLAGGWEIEVQGLRANATGYAGRSAVAEDASTVWFNPAGMTNLDELSIVAGLPIIDLSIEFNDAGSLNLLGQPMIGNPVQDGGFTSAPPHIYVARKVSDRFATGFGFHVPFGLGTDYGETWVGRYFSTKAELLVFNLSPAVAFEISDSLSIGAALDVQYSDATLANMIDFGSIGAASMLPLTPQMHDGRIEIKADDWAVGFHAGLLWEPNDATSVGLTYRGKTTHRLEGDADFTVPPEAMPLTMGGLVFQDTTAVSELPMAANASLSLRRQIGGRWTFLADVTWTEWSAFEALTVDFANPAQPQVFQPADWDDTVRPAIGATYEGKGRWTYRFGYAYEPTPPPDATREPRVPEDTHNWVNIGASYRIGDRMDLDLLYVHLFSGDASINISDMNSGTLIGETQWNVNVLGVGLTVRR